MPAPPSCHTYIVHLFPALIQILLCFPALLEMLHTRTRIWHKHREKHGIKHPYTHKHNDWTVALMSTEFKLKSQTFYLHRKPWNVGFALIHREALALRRFETHMFSLSFEVLAVLHQLSVHSMSHLLGHQLPLTGVVVELVQDGVEGQTWREPAANRQFSVWIQLLVVTGSAPP